MLRRSERQYFRNVNHPEFQAQDLLLTEELIYLWASSLLCLNNIHNRCILVHVGLEYGLGLFGQNKIYPAVTDDLDTNTDRKSVNYFLIY